MKRAVLEEALLVLIRADLAGIVDDSEGLMYRATDRGPVFVDVLEASYVESLRERAEWAVHRFAARSDARAVTQEIIERASAELTRSGAGHE